MNTSTPDTTHPLYARALAHAEKVLQLPIEEIREKLRTKTEWQEDRLPTVEELAILILKWADKVGAK